MDILFLIIGLIIGVTIGFLVSKSFNSKLKNLESENANLQVDKKTLDNKIAHFEGENQKLNSEINALREANQVEVRNAIEWKGKFDGLQDKLATQKEELESLQEKFSKEFELVANKILEEKSSKFTDQNKKNIDEILNPLKERISEFQKKVEDTNEKNIERTASLDQHLKMLKELNQEITQETKSLTQALRGDSKTQGNWGEMHLESILEKAGLQKGVHYTKETNVKTEDGSNQRLDYIINMPDGKNLILDSKVSLTAYSKYHEAESDEQRAIALKDHLASVHQHIKLLGSKDYQQLHGINSPDYVMMFIANEPALTLALKEDQSLFEKALDKNIVLVSTSTLLATLRTISYIWKQDLQNKNAEEIARQAASLYDKFASFSQDLIKLGSQLETVSGTYRESMKKLSEGKDNLVRKTERLKELGVNPSKNIDNRLIDRSED